MSRASTADSEMPLRTSWHGFSTRALLMKHALKTRATKRRPRFLNCSIAILIAILGLLLFTGCANQQEKDVAKYRSVLDGPHPPPLPDFSHGRPLTLETAMLLANRNEERLDNSGQASLQA